jgi:hypothetical protein
MVSRMQYLTRAFVTFEDDYGCFQKACLSRHWRSDLLRKVTAKTDEEIDV